MKKIFLIGSIFLLSISLLANEDDWNEEESGNSVFEKMKIKNRSKKEYDDKIYKYIKGDFNVKNNDIEIANIELDDDLRSDSVEVNVFVENLKVEGDDFQEPLDLKRNRYKNYTKHDRRDDTFFDKDEVEFEKFAGIENEAENINQNSLSSSTIRRRDSQYEDNNDSDISQLETIDLRGNRHVKEVNVFIEDTRIIVDK